MNPNTIKYNNNGEINIRSLYNYHQRTYCDQIVRPNSSGRKN